MLSTEDIGGERLLNSREFCEKKVLIIEDDPTLTKFWIILLMELRLKDSRVVGTAVEALNFLRWHGADLVITDLCLHDVSGIDLVKKAHQMNPLTKTVITSSSFDISLPLDPKGFVHFLKKPYNNLDELKAWIRLILSDSSKIEKVERENPGVYVWNV